MAKKQISKQSKALIQKRVNMDGWANVLTGLGVKGMDKRLSAEVNWERLPEVDADNLYAADEMAAKIVDALVDESLREGFELEGIDKEQAKKLLMKASEMQILPKFAHAWKMARRYGGAGLIMLTDEMRNLQEPMRPNAFLRGVNAVSMWELYAQHEDMDFNLLSPNYLTPRVYSYQPRVSGSTVEVLTKIHATRIIRFDGKTLPLRFMQQNNYWGDSVLNNLQNSIRNYQLSHDAASSTLQDFRIAVFKIKNLADQIAADNDDLIIKRMEIANLSRSVARAVVIDAEGEDFEYKIGSVAGVSELLGKVENRLVGGTNIPRTVLLGESPTGMGGTGRHEQDNWYDYIASQQETYLKPKLLQVFKMIAAELGIAAEGLDLTFKPLYQLDDMETATLRKTQAETDQIYIQNGVVDADEVSLSRFAGGKYSMETQIEETLRQAEPITGEMVEGAQPAPQAENVQQQALNGAQVTSMIEIVQSVATGNLPRESGLFMLQKAFNMTSDEAEKVMGLAGKGFKPSGTPLPGEGGGGSPKFDGAFKEMQIELDEGTWGGAREGAGRKPGSGNTKKVSNETNISESDLESLSEQYDIDNPLFHGSLDNNLKGFESVVGNEKDLSTNYGQKRGVGTSFSPDKSYSEQYVSKNGIGEKTGQVYTAFAEKGSIVNVEQNPNAVREAAQKMGVEQHVSSLFNSQPNIQLERALMKGKGLSKKEAYEEMVKNGIKGFVVGGDNGIEYLMHDPSGLALFNQKGEKVSKDSNTDGIKSNVETGDKFSTAKPAVASGVRG
jgi:hypothetical protein